MTVAEDMQERDSDGKFAHQIRKVECTVTVIYMVHSDHLARPIRVTDAARATQWQATWGPWGEPYAISGTLALDMRFPGQLFQIETGLHYNWHRHYDPVTGRYTQPDPLRFVDGPSVYAYAGSSPFVEVDRKGLSSSVELPRSKDPRSKNHDYCSVEVALGLEKDCHSFCTDKCVGRGLGSDAPFCYWKCMRECESW